MAAFQSRSTPNSAVLTLHRVARIALLSITLGVCVQSVVLGLLVWERGAGELGLLIDAAAGVSWSLLVCTGVGIGTLLTKGRPRLNGLIATALAPASLAAAKAGGKALSGWLEALQSEAILSLGVVGTIRAVEYGLLSWLLGRFVAAERQQPWPYLGAGAVAGGFFGSAVTIMTVRVADLTGKPLSDVRITTTAVNEVLFPIGCAFVIYLGLEIGRSLKLVGSEPNNSPLAN